MLDHVSLGVTDLERSRRFYDAALRPVGLVRILDFEGRGSDYGAMPGQLDVEFTITAELSARSPAPGMHFCSRSGSGGPFMPPLCAPAAATTEPPGDAPVYHPDYYAAFILDPDGHRIEAVCHAPESPETA